MQDNERRDCQLIVGTKEESLVVLVDDRRRIDMKRGLVVEGNPPEFFDLMRNVLTTEKMNHPVAAFVTAF